jgi:HlyD family secretion protein
MNKTRLTITAAAGLLTVGGLWFYRRAEAKEAPQYRTATVERGTVKATVSATGTLNAVRTVQVGTQVSGQISAIHVDFNDHVRKGQLLARIDPTLQLQSVEDAQAGLERAQAQLTQAQSEYERNKQLYDAKVITASEFGNVQSTFAVQQAAAKSARIALDRARQNLSYTSIYSPIDGVIVERNVDVGQTVAASLSAPTLFLIANDLSEMQILASVDESDIGQITTGMPVQFTVQAYPNQTFSGQVEQVRLQSKTQDNVVNYTAVVRVKNPGNKLLPGMTATVQFLTGSADNVLTVPNAALRFRPTAEMTATLRGQSGNRAPGDSTRPRHAGGDSTARRFGGARDSSAARANRGSMSMLWYVDSVGAVKATRVRPGVTDGQKTAVEGQGVKEGMQVIIGVAEGTQAAAPATTNGRTQSTNPFQPQRGPGPGRGF